MIKLLIALFVIMIMIVLILIWATTPEKTEEEKPEGYIIISDPEKNTTIIKRWTRSEPT